MGWGGSIKICALVARPLPMPARPLAPVPDPFSPFPHTQVPIAVPALRQLDTISPSGDWAGCHGVRLLVVIVSVAPIRSRVSDGRWPALAQHIAILCAKRQMRLRNTTDNIILIILN